MNCFRTLLAFKGIVRIGSISPCPLVFDEIAGKNGVDISSPFFLSNFAFPLRIWPPDFISPGCSSEEAACSDQI